MLNGGPVASEHGAAASGEVLAGPEGSVQWATPAHTLPFSVPTCSVNMQKTAK